jgi:site-specific DNA-methyltransferase (adenine-specific)
MAIELLNCDCMDYMAGLDDNAFELAITDPPYGIGESGGSARTRGKKEANHKRKEWDNSTPNGKYFSELKRVSKNQIIWGANYFPNYLQSSMAWICWDKKLDNSDFSDFELAYSSFKRSAKIFRFSKNGGSRTPTALAAIIHPTQKPVKLYEWLLKNYAKEGDRILDTHLGSGSSAIAAHYGGFDFVGYELDQDYYNAACKRFDDETRQQAMF